MRNFNNSTMADDNYNTSQSNLTGAPQAVRQVVGEQQQQQQQQHQQQQQQQRPIRTDSLQELNDELQAGTRQPSIARTTRIADEMSQDLQYLSREAPLDGGESTFGGAYSTLGGGGGVAGTGAGGANDNATTTTQHTTYTSTITRTTSGSRDGGGLENDYERTDFRIADDDDDDDDEQQVRPTTRTTREQFSEPPSSYVLEQLAPDNVDLQRPLQQAGSPIDLMDDNQLQVAQGQTSSACDDEPIVRLLADDDATAAAAELDNRTLVNSPVASQRPLKPFLVSFMVDARGGAMRGCRHSGVRVIIPPGSAQQPMRITCRYLRRERLVHPPPLMEGEACASKIMEVGPAGMKFLGPVLIEVPHFASLRGKEREIIILRSDTGEVWREHLVEASEELVESIIDSAKQVPHDDEAENVRPASADGALINRGGGGGGGDSQQQEKRLTRIVTDEFPQYFAIISRIRQQIHSVGPDGSVVDSQVVPKVQAIFTEGALTKRIKIGLQKKQSPDQSPQLEAKEAHQIASQTDNERPQSPSSTGTGNARPSSAAAKRRSRFLACFGAGQGSSDLLDQHSNNNAHTTDGEFASGSAEDSSLGDHSAGDNSPRQKPRQPVHEKPCERRYIIEDISDSEQEAATAAASDKLSPRLRKKRSVSNYVPVDYYIEQESPLILNVEPTTYGKRLASSSAQTDQKLQTQNGFMSTSTRSNKKRRGLLGGAGKRSRRNKTQMTIPLHEPLTSAAPKHKKQQCEEVDSSLESQGLTSRGFDSLVAAAADGEKQTDVDELKQEALSTTDSKWLTRTIQTDSDSVTVQYVTIYGNNTDSTTGETAGVAATATTATPAGQDDGYVSGSGDLKKDATAAGHKSKSGRIFSPFCGVSSKADDDEQLADDETDVQLKLNESGQLDVADDSLQTKTKKAQRKKAKSSSSSGKKSPQATNNLDIVLEVKTPDLELAQQRSAATSPSPTTDDAATQAAAGEVSRSSVSPPTTSATSSSKELKLKLKLEKAEKAKREKLEKAKQKELDEATAKLEKAKRKLEKEAKKKAAKVGGKLPVLEASSPVADDSSSSSSANDTNSKSTGGGFALGTTIAKTIQSVKFAPSPSKTSAAGPAEGIEPRLESEAEGEKKDNSDSARASPSKKMMIDSISLPKFKLPKLKLGGGSGGSSSVDKPSLEEPEVAAPDQPDSMVHVSISADTSLPDLEKAKVELPEVEQTVTIAKPKGILKQASGSIESAEITIGEQPQTLRSIASELVSEATEAAVRAADEMQREQQRAALESPTLPSSLSLSLGSSESKKELAKRQKAERVQLKRDVKAKLEEEKKLLKEAEEAAKQAQEAAKRALNEANKVSRDLAAEAELQARIAQQEAERAVQEVGQQQVEVELSGAELKRKAKEAEAEAKRKARELEEELKKKAREAEEETKRKAKEAKEEAKRAAKEAKKKLKLGLKVVPPTLSSSADSSAADDATNLPSVSQDLPAVEQTDEIQIETKAAEVEASAAESEPTPTPTESEQKKVKSSTGGGLDIKLPKFNLKFGGGGGNKSSSKGGDDDKNDNDEEKVVAPPIEQATIAQEEVTKDKDTSKSKSGKKAKKLKEKQKSGATRSSSSSLSETSEPTVSKSSSFLGRLFRAKPTTTKAPVVVDISGELPQVELPKDDEQQKQQQQVQERVKRETTTIVSEMYPSDPNNTEGEMILEVNVPENLISNNNNNNNDNQDIQLKPHDLDEQPQKITTTTTTTTVTSLSSTAGLPTTTDDQEATLVNISQTLAEDDEDDDDEATENVLSQAHELPLDSSAHSTEPQVQISTTITTSEHQSSPPGQVAESVSVRTSGGQLLDKIPEELSEQPAQAVVSEPPAQPLPVVSPDARELKSEKNRKELEAKLEKEAKKRAKEEAKLAKKREKEEKKLAEVEAKKRAEEEKERVKREAQEAKRLAELAKREAKEAKKREKKTKNKNEQVKSEPEVAVAVATTSSEAPEVEPVTSSVSTAILTTTTTTRGDQANLLPDVVEPTTTTTTTDETDDTTGRLLMSSKHEIPVNEETEVERIVEEVVGEDGTVTKTTKLIETKYITMRQEELRVAERRDMAADEWQRVQAERAAANQTKQQLPDESQIVSSKAHVELVPAEEPELVQICATPSFFDPHTLPAEIKPETAPKKAMKKRVRLNQKLIKRAFKVARAEAKKAKRSQKKAEAEIAVCDEASRQARKQLKRAVSEAKRAAKEAAKRHKKMDKMDRKLEKRAKKIEKRQKEIDKKVAKLEKKAAKKREKLAKKEAKAARRSPSRSSKKSLKLEDIGEPILKSSGGSRLSIQRQRSSADLEDDFAATSAHRNTISSTGGGDLPEEVAVSIDTTNELTQEQINQLIKDGKESVVHTITKTITIEGDGGEPARVETSERVLRGPEAEEAALRAELEAARQEDDGDIEIDVVGDDDDDVEPELRHQSSQETPEVSEVSEPKSMSSSSSSSKKNKNKRNKNKKSKSKE